MASSPAPGTRNESNTSCEYDRLCRPWFIPASTVNRTCPFGHAGWSRRTTTAGDVYYANDADRTTTSNRPTTPQAAPSISSPLMLSPPAGVPACKHTIIHLSMWYTQTQLNTLRLYTTIALLWLYSCLRCCACRAFGVFAKPTATSSRLAIPVFKAALPNVRVNYSPRLLPPPCVIPFPLRDYLNAHGTPEIIGICSLPCFATEKHRFLAKARLLQSTMYWPVRCSTMWCGTVRTTLFLAIFWLG